MNDQEYSEPSNEQLANFLIIYAKQMPSLDNLHLSAPILISILERDSRYREGALRHHRRWQQEIYEHIKKMKTGNLQCDHIRPNGKQCPNFNQPGSYYCGLHDKEE